MFGLQIELGCAGSLFPCKSHGDIEAVSYLPGVHGSVFTFIQIPEFVVDELGQIVLIGRAEDEFPDEEVPDARLRIKVESGKRNHQVDTRRQRRIGVFEGSHADEGQALRVF